MVKANVNYGKLEASYLFSNIAQKVAEFQKTDPEARIIRMGIGDVTLPLCPTVIEAMHRAVDDLGKKESFRGYGPEQGYDFLRERIQEYYRSHGVELPLAEIFISDGAKSDVGNILDLFALENEVVVPDPVYPV